MGQKTAAANFVISCFLLMAAPCDAQESGRRHEQSVVGYAVRPARRDFNESLVNQLRVPAGFRVNVFARGLTNPRMMAVAPDGAVYVTDRDKGDVVALSDRDGDGRSDGTRIVVPNLARVHGITIHQNRLYLATIKGVYVADLKPDGTASAPRMLIRDLPEGGQHDNRTIAFGREECFTSPLARPVTTARSRTKSTRRSCARTLMAVVEPSLRTATNAR